MDDPEIRVATSTQDFDAARVLFLDYAATFGLDFDFLDFELELSTLEHSYLAPSGQIILLSDDEVEVGVIAIKKYDDEAAELQRAYLKEAYWNDSHGPTLLAAGEKAARRMGYTSMLAHLLPSMNHLMDLCKASGFMPTPPFRFDSLPGSVFLRKELS